MSQSTEVQIKVHPRHAADMLEIRKALCVHLSCTDPDLPNFVVRKKSIDARGKSPVVILRILLNPAESIVNSVQYSKVQSDRTGYIVGAGPAGYFAALKLISLGVKPVIFERGKDAQVRRRDLRGLQQFGIVNSNSNYCYGEGGAGTYSDGKLYTRSNKRGNVKGVLQTLVDHGAPIDIMIDAHPHIGSNKLPTVVSNIRKTILDCGGEIHFDSKVTDLHIVDKKIKGVVINDEKEVSLDNLILATGHSARDIYTLLESKDIRMDLKPFAIGVRIEHSQELIDDIQYGKNKRGDYLPAAPYRLACQIGEKGVYSFCMCPGGLIVPTATDVGEIVVNGMSLSKRDSPYANAGTVVEITPEDIGSNKAMDGIDYQRKVEQKIFDYGDGTQKAPAQRLVDFVEGKMSQSLNQSSYIPGIYAANMYDLLPSIVSNSLRQAIKVFGKKMNGYYTNEAQIIGLESRTSSPIRIPRDKETYMHEDCFGLFPCGEGAGYAGGIVSAAIDGENVALKVVESFKEG